MSTKPPGLTLLDIAGTSEVVSVGDTPITVYGISIRTALKIVERFPAILKMFTEGFNFEDIIKVAPDAIAAIIASSLGKIGDVEEEEAAERLPLDIQLEFLLAIGRLTFKNGFGPFVSRVIALADAAPKSASFGKATDTSSLSLSNSSSQPATAT